MLERAAPGGCPCRRSVPQDGEARGAALELNLIRSLDELLRAFKYKRKENTVLCVNF